MRRHRWSKRWRARFPARITFACPGSAICRTSKRRRCSTRRSSSFSPTRSGPTDSMNAPLDTHDRDAPIFAADAFRLGDEEAALIAKARRFGARVLAPRAEKHDREATFPIENFRDMHGEGLLGICILKQHGGLGASYRTYCLAAAELGRYCGATALSWNMHVCSTLWTGALADDLEMSAQDRAEHNARRPAHYRRIIADGAIYSQ